MVTTVVGAFRRGGGSGDVDLDVEVAVGSGVTVNTEIVSTSDNHFRLRNDFLCPNGDVGVVPAPKSGEISCHHVEVAVFRARTGFGQDPVDFVND